MVQLFLKIQPQKTKKTQKWSYENNNVKSIIPRIKTIQFNSKLTIVVWKNDASTTYSALSQIIVFYSQPIEYKSTSLTIQ